MRIKNILLSLFFFLQYVLRGIFSQITFDTKTLSSPVSGEANATLNNLPNAQTQAYFVFRCIGKTKWSNGIFSPPSYFAVSNLRKVVPTSSSTGTVTLAPFTLSEALTQEIVVVSARSGGWLLATTSTSNLIDAFPVAVANSFISGVTFKNLDSFLFGKSPGFSRGRKSSTGKAYYGSIVASRIVGLNESVPYTALKCRIRFNATGIVNSIFLGSDLILSDSSLVDGAFRIFVTDDKYLFKRNDYYLLSIFGSVELDVTATDLFDCEATNGTLIGTVQASIFSIINKVANSTTTKTVAKAVTCFSGCQKCDKNNTCLATNCLFNPESPQCVNMSIANCPAQRPFSVDLSVRDSCFKKIASKMLLKELTIASTGITMGPVLTPTLSQGLLVDQYCFLYAEIGTLQISNKFFFSANLPQKIKNIPAAPNSRVILRFASYAFNPDFPFAPKKILNVRLSPQSSNFTMVVRNLTLSGFKELFNPTTNSFNGFEFEATLQFSVRKDSAYIALFHINKTSTNNRLGFRIPTDRVTIFSDGTSENLTVTDGILIYSPNLCTLLSPCFLHIAFISQNNGIFQIDQRIIGTGFTSPFSRPLKEIVFESGSYCPDGAVVKTDPKKCECGDGYFLNVSRNLTCLRCHTSCYTCSGLSSNNCTSCPATFVLSSGKCVCGSGFILTGSKCVAVVVPSNQTGTNTQKNNTTTPTNSSTSNTGQASNSTNNQTSSNTTKTPTNTTNAQTNNTTIPSNNSTNSTSPLANLTNSQTSLNTTKTPTNTTNIQMNNTTIPNNNFTNNIGNSTNNQTSSNTTNTPTNTTNAQTNNTTIPSNNSTNSTSLLTNSTNNKTNLNTTNTQQGNTSNPITITGQINNSSTSSNQTNNANITNNNTNNSIITQNQNTTVNDSNQSSIQQGNLTDTFSSSNNATNPAVPSPTNSPGNNAGQTNTASRISNQTILNDQQSDANTNNGTSQNNNQSINDDQSTPNDDSNNVEENQGESSANQNENATNDQTISGDGNNLLDGNTGSEDKNLNSTTSNTNNNDNSQSTAGQTSGSNDESISSNHESKNQTTQDSQNNQLNSTDTKPENVKQEDKNESNMESGLENKDNNNKSTDSKAENNTNFDDELSHNDDKNSGNSSVNDTNEKSNKNTNHTDSNLEIIQQEGKINSTGGFADKNVGPDSYKNNPSNLYQKGNIDNKNAFPLIKTFYLLFYGVSFTISFIYLKKSKLKISPARRESIYAVTSKPNPKQAPNVLKSTFINYSPIFFILNKNLNSKEKSFCVFHCIIALNFKLFITALLSRGFVNSEEMITAEDVIKYFAPILASELSITTTFTLVYSELFRIGKKNFLIWGIIFSTASIGMVVATERLALDKLENDAGGILIALFFVSSVISYIVIDGLLALLTKNMAFIERMRKLNLYKANENIVQVVSVGSLQTINSLTSLEPSANTKTNLIFKLFKVKAPQQETLQIERNGSLPPLTAPASPGITTNRKFN